MKRWIEFTDTDRFLKTDTIHYVPADAITSIIYDELNDETMVNIFGEGKIIVQETVEEIKEKIDVALNEHP